MQKKQLVIETKEGKEEFEIDESGGKFYIYTVTTNFSGSKQSKKIGDALSWEAAVGLAKIFVGKPL